MRSYFSKFASAFSVVFVVFLVCSSGLAQPRAARGRIFTKGDVDRIIKRVEERTDKFKKEFDRALDNSRLNNSNREDKLNDYAKDLEHATDDLRHQFDRTDQWIENKDQVRKCLTLATKLNVAMRNRRLGPKVESTWSALRFDLNTLAGVYNLPLVGSPEYF